MALYRARKNRSDNEFSGRRGPAEVFVLITLFLRGLHGGNRIVSRLRARSAVFALALAKHLLLFEASGFGEFPSSRCGVSDPLIGLRQ